MNPFVPTGRRSLVRRFVTAGVVLVLIVVGAIAAGRVQSDSTAPLSGPSAPGVSPKPSPSGDEMSTRGEAPPSGSRQAVAFARQVTDLLFTWDTVSGPDPTTIRGELVALADPTGEETPGLLADLGMYLPDDVAWPRLESLGARQWVDVEHVVVPAGWADASDGEPGLAGTYAVNVAGTRHREASAAGLADRTANPVVFTVFVHCPTDESCSLLRLGRLGETWEG